MICETQPRTQTCEWPSIEVGQKSNIWTHIETPSQIKAGDTIRLSYQPIVQVLATEDLGTKVSLIVAKTTGEENCPTEWLIPKNAAQNPQSSAPAKTDRSAVALNKLKSEPTFPSLNKRLAQVAELERKSALQAIFGKSDRLNTEPTEASAEPDLYKLRVSQLKKLCKERGLHGYSKLRQHQLIKLLQEQTASKNATVTQTPDIEPEKIKHQM
ncbi:MAG: hypothetical protein F6J93_31265 [Oscillatoria sp. SIO1A7]|nr:hypothetical protein [Oscillatoria sp. SIO1A7]